MKLKNPNKVFPLFLTNNLEATKAFYEGRAGFRVVFDLASYLQVAHGAEGGPELCFMKPGCVPRR